MKLEINKIRKIAGWTISGLLVAIFLYSASGKFLNPEEMENMGLADWRIIIAIGEITSALLFLFPKTNIYGTILLSSYMGGAIIIHMMVGISIIMPSAILVIIWIGSIIRQPELLTGFSKK